MKKLITVALLALLSAVAFGATLAPVSMLSPTGSTSGQVVASTGASSAPAWTTITLSGLGGTVGLANGGTGATTAAAARTNLGLGTAAVVNTGTSGATIPLLSAANTWTLGQVFSVRPTFNGATPWDSANLAAPAATTGTLAQFASTTSAQLAGVLSDETGTGFAVFATSPIITTPNIQGVTNGATTGAGFVGQIIANTPSPTSISTATNTNLASISLTAGKWLVWGYTTYAAGASTTISNIVAGLSTTSATLPGIPYYAQSNATMTTATSSSLNIPIQIINVSATTTVFAVGQVTFASGTCTHTTFLSAVRIL